MGSELLTAIVPIGPKHMEQNRISDWLNEANQHSESLKLLLIEDIGSDVSCFPPSDRMYLKFKNFEVHRRKLGGPGQARNFGLKLVQSPWVCFWDSDDLPKISLFFQSILKVADSNSEVLIGDYTKVIGFGRTEKALSGHKADLKQIAIEPGIWRMAFQTKIIKEIEFESLKMAEDQIFLLDLNLANREISFTDDVLYSYTVESPNQLTSDAKAKEDLAEAISLIHGRIKLGTIQVNEFTALILMKISLTFLKTSSLGDKIIATYSLLKSFILLGGFRQTVISYLFKTFYASLLNRI